MDHDTEQFLSVLGNHDYVAVAQQVRGRKVLGARIRARRQAVGMTCREVARLAGCSEVAMCEMESGRKSYSAQRLARVAAALGTTAEALKGVSPGSTGPGTD